MAELLKDVGSEVKNEQKKQDLLFVDVEMNPDTGKLINIGAIDERDNKYNGKDRLHFKEFAEEYNMVCGHNFVRHDLRYLKNCIDDKTVVADTLYIAGLLFPGSETLRLSKEYKLKEKELSDPVIDAKHSRNLFYDEIIAFDKLIDEFKRILYLLLHDKVGFEGLFKYIGYETNGDIEKLIRQYFKGRICENSDGMKAMCLDLY